MAQVGFKGHARRSGFAPVQAGYQKISRMKEYADDVVRNMKEDQRARRARRDQYESGLQRKQSLEEQNRRANYDLEERYAANRQRSVQAKRQEELSAANSRAASSQAEIKNLQALANFSETISKIVIDDAKKRNDEAMQAGYLDAMMNGLPTDEMENFNAAEDVLAKSGEQMEQIADGMARNGTDPQMVMQIRTGNKWRDYGIAKARAEMVGNSFGSWANEKLLEMRSQGQINNPEDVAGAMASLQMEYLKQNGLYGASAPFLADTFKRMRQSTNAAVSDERQRTMAVQSQNMQDEAINNFVNLKSGGSMNQAYLDITRTYDNNGNPVNGRDARGRLFKAMSDVSLFPDGKFEELANTPTLDQPTKTWEQRFPVEFDEMREQRNSDRERDRAAVRAEERANGEAAEEAALEWVETEWNGDEETLTQLISESKQRGVPTARLQAYLYNSTQKSEARVYDRLFESQYKNGSLTLEDVNDPKVPISIRNKWQQFARESDTALADSGADLKTIKNTFNKALRSSLSAESLDKTPHYSIDLAQAEAMNEWGRRFKAYSRTMDPAKAAAQATNDVLLQIQNKSDQFTVTKGVEGRDGKQAFFNSFTPGNHTGAPMEAISQSDANLRIRQFREDPNIVNTTVLVSPALLKKISEDIQAGRRVSMPGLYNDISALTGKDSTDILNAQLKAGGFPQQSDDSLTKSLSQVNDPSFRRLLRRLDEENLQTRIITNGDSVGYIRKGAKGFNDVMSLGSNANFPHPALMSAQWALESGYGRHSSGRNNLWGIKGAGSTVQTQEFEGGRMVPTSASFRDYNSPLESAQDYTNFMNDPRYSAVLQASTPREAAMAIQEAGYATDPGYADKLIRIMKDNGINVDAPSARYEGPPTRNPNYMSPTLAAKSSEIVYVTGDIGPTSTGPHLDIKRTDREYFPADALDGYVTIHDPEFGPIGPGALRLRTGNIGSSWDEHVARGSHGWDYGTHSGTKISLRNGARVVSTRRSAHGDVLTIRTPNGVNYTLIHGKSL